MQTICSSGVNLRVPDCHFRESLAKLEKIENPDNLPEVYFWGAISENII